MPRSHRSSPIPEMTPKDTTEIQPRAARETSPAEAPPPIVDSILETVGNTPMVRLRHLAAECPAVVLAKVESFNPGGSVKDRIAIAIVEEAEAKGLLKPGGAIVEATSGNTGMGLALVAAVKGYRAIF